MSSLPLGGGFIKFATKNHRLPSGADPNIAPQPVILTRPKTHIAVYLLTVVSRS